MNGKDLILTRCRAWLQRRRSRFALAAAAIVLIALVVAFHPGVQTALVRKYVPPLVDSFAIERVHVLPWSVTVDGLDVNVQGARIALPHAEIGIAPWRLLFGVVVVDGLDAREFLVDLREMPPSTEPAAPFPGLFALLDQGFGLVLDEAIAFGEVLIAPGVHADVVLRGHGIAPLATGTLDLDFTLHRDEDDSRVELSGPLTVAQAADGRCTGLGAELLALAVSSALPQEELVSLHARLVPLEALQDDGEGVPPSRSLQGDRFEIKLVKRDEQGELVVISADGQHHAGTRRVDGAFALAVHNGVVKTYLPTARLPSIEERAAGHFVVALDSGRTELDYAGDMRLSALERVLGVNAALPATLRWANAFKAVFDAGALELTTLTSALEDGDGKPLLTFALTEPLVVPIDAPTTVFERSHTLARLALGALPVTWLNGLLPGPVLREGTLGGAFELRAGDAALTMAPTAAFSASQVHFEDSVAVTDAITLAGEPTLRFHNGTLRLDVKGFAFKLGERELVRLDLDARLPLTVEDPPAPRVKLAGRFDVDGILALPPVAAKLPAYSLPADLMASIEADVSVRAARIDARAVSVKLGRKAGSPIVSVRSLAPFAAELGGENPEWRLAKGELATVAIDGLDLAWVDPYVPDWSVSGTLVHAVYTVTAAADGAVELRAGAPLSLRRFALASAEETLVEDLTLSVRADVDYTPDRAAVRYSALDLQVSGAALARGAGSLVLPLGAAGPIAARGEMTVELAALDRLPALAEVFAQRPPQRHWQLALDYDLNGDASRIAATKLDAGISIDGARRLHLASTAPLTINPQRAPGDDLAHHLTGALALTLDELSSTLLADLVDLGGIEFSSLAGQATLSSDGRELVLEARRALSLAGARIVGEKGALIEAFDLAAAAEVHVHGQTIDVALDALDLTFAARPAEPALAGKLSFTVEPGRPIPLRRMQAALVGALPALFDQPVLLPGHGLTGGRVALDASVAEDGTIASTARLDGLQSAKPLAITDVEGTATGNMALDGRGFSFTMRVLGNGRSGQTDGVLEARFDPSGDDTAAIGFDFDSALFYLNDVLATLDSIAGADAPPVAGKAADEPAATRPDQEADDSAFWDFLPYRARLAYHVGDLYYTDYVVFNDVAGEIRLRPERLTLRELRARFHDSPIDFDGKLDFLANTPKPYVLEFAGKVEEFDLNQFFTELVPGAKPRVEGLFGITVDGQGSAPNMAQFRNDLLFDMHLQSRDGVFRPLPPDSGLLVGASDALGLVGEGLSYIPTSGFGAGTLSRLVNYIALIDYDRIDIRVVRDESRDINIRRFRVQSPTVSFKARGGIEYVEGKDILDSPLTLDANLDMSGRGAAILYSMNLLEDGQDAQGYHKGPSFRIRGTPAATESNLEEILTAAADGTVKGGITRPIAGLIGNLRYRWFGEKPERLEESETAAETTPVVEPADRSQATP